MEYFLERIAHKIFNEYGNVLNRHCLVFPSRRAGLYFLKYLSSAAEKPVWAPPIMTVNELFRTFSDLKTAENEVLLFELYKIYRNLKKSPESFDEFFFWGDMLLNDFDDIDKYLADAGALFTNVGDIKKIDELFGGFSVEQKEIIRRFWLNFDPDKPSREKDGFISIWGILPQLYENFGKALEKKGLGYEGMIFRKVIEENEGLPSVKIPWDKVHFIGFNALNRCEEKLMLMLRKEGKAGFYWDYDNSYIEPGTRNSAGYFMKKNLKLFGNDMPEDWSFDSSLSANNPGVNRRVIDASSDVAQVKLLPSLIKDLGELTPERACHTAVILADENLLVPVLTSLPDDSGDINITMGFPLKQTPVFFLVHDLLALQKSCAVRDGVLYFRREYAGSIPDNTFIKYILTGKNELPSSVPASNSPWIPASFSWNSEFLSTIFSRPATPSLLSDYFRNILSEMALYNREDIPGKNLTNEFIYRIVLCLNRLGSISGSTDVAFSTETWMRLFEKLLRVQTVPFSGEPLSGIQIMGVLETRALDFENIILLSVNEGVLPSASSGSSFIPFSIREAFGLPSINHQESIYAYHFYRLLQRARNVTFVYNSNSEGLRSGEMSRFLLQLKYERNLCPEFSDLNFTIKTAPEISETVIRTPAHSELLRKRFTGEKVLSPSAINTWLNCRMKFYFRYINGLFEPDTVSSEIDPAALGSILHDIISQCYSGFTGKEVGMEQICTILDEDVLTGKIDNAFQLKFNREHGYIPEGKEIIVREVLLAYLKRILNADLAYAPFRVLHLEKQFTFGVDTGAGDGAEVRTGGKIDRIDSKNGKIRIVDYKTGTIADSIKSIGSLFDDDRKKDPDGWLQILLYCEAFRSAGGSGIIYPVIYRIRKNDNEKLNGKLVIKADRDSETIVDDYSMVREQFMNGLREVVKKIFSDEENFTMTSDTWGKCSGCPYRSLCLR